MRKEYDRDRGDRRGRASYDRKDDRSDRKDDRSDRKEDRSDRKDDRKDDRREEKRRRSKERKKEGSSSSDEEGGKGGGGGGGDGFWDTKWDAMQLEEKLAKGEKRGRYYLNTKKRFKVRIMSDIPVRHVRLIFVFIITSIQAILD